MNLPVEYLPLLLLAGAAAGFVNTIAGAGSVFTFPLLVLLGFSPHTASGTVRVTILMQNLVAISTFASRGHFFPRQAAILATAAIPAALVGAWAAVNIDPVPFRRLAGALLLVVLATLFVRPAAWNREKAQGEVRWGPVLLLTAAVGFYGGFFQLGVGLPFLAVAVLSGGWDLVSANAIKGIVVMLFALMALFVFASHGQVDWEVGIVLGAGNMLGAWIGARTAVKRGPAWIRIVLAVMAAAAATKLLFT